MEGFLEKPGKPESRISTGIRRKHKNEEKQIEEPPVKSGEKKNDRFIRRGKKEKESTVSQNLQKDEPITFHAHALDLDSDVVIPPRPSIDLTYNDFTRESYEADENRPFIPRKKQSVPFELSETPHMQSEYWEGKTSGRRKPANSADNAASSESRGESRQTQESKHSDNSQSAAEKAAESRDGKERKRVKDKTPRKAPEKEAKPDSTGEAVDAKTQEGGKRREFTKRRQKNAGDAGVKKQEKREEKAGADPTSRETSKESLMRPYWMKK